jgi:archaellum component FlaF (FlaF/FlaG flagellin family)
MHTTKKNTLLIIAALIVIGVAALAYYQFVMKANDLSSITKETVENTTVGITFSYPSSEDGFALVEPPLGDTGLLAAYVLIPSKEYDDYKVSTEGREVPAAMSVLVYELDTATSSMTASGSERIDRVTRLQNWAIDNHILTSYTQAKATPDIIEIDGVKALHYQADGLYQQDIYLVSYKNRAYMLVGQYNAQSDMTYTAFQELIGTVNFN